MRLKSGSKSKQYLSSTTKTTAALTILVALKICKVMFLVNKKSLF